MPSCRKRSWVLHPTGVALSDWLEFGRFTKKRRRYAASFIHSHYLSTYKSLYSSPCGFSLPFSINIYILFCFGVMDGKKLEYKGDNALRELERLTTNAREVQEMILKEILTRNGATEYLSKYMKGSTDVAEYKRRVPVITYDEIQPYIRRIANGEDSSIISGYPITEMLTSSGTSGGEPRLMPSIAEDIDRRTYLYNLIMPIMNQ